MGVRVGFVLGLLAASFASGEGAGWSTRGPAGGNVYCLVADPTRPATLYAGTDVGVYKSDDGGASWRAATNGIPLNRVQTIAIDPTSPATLYAGTLTPDGVASVGIFKSTDAGASWTAINEGLADPLAGFAPLDVEALAVNPRNPQTILAGTRFSEIFKSVDGGATWKPKTLGGINVALETAAFQFDPSGSSTIYAASTQGFLRSTDGGETWNTFGNAGNPFYSLAIDPTSASTLYAGTVNGNGIFKSTDSGNRWSAVNKNLPVNQSAGTTYLPLTLTLVVDPSKSSTLYAGSYGNGVFVSTDGAATWAPATSGMRSAYVASLLFAPGQSSTIYAGTYGGGVYQSLDGARSWSPATTGINLSLVRALAADPAAGNTVYAAVSDGVQKSVDAGGTWRAANNGLPVFPVYGLAFQRGSAAALFAATSGGGLFKSTDGAASWSASGQGLNDLFLSSIAVDPSNASILYAGTNHPYDGSNSQRVYKSNDGGGTWTQTPLDAKGFSISFVGVNPARSAQVVAVSRGAAGYFQSLDGGATWSVAATDTVCGGVNTILFDSSGSTTYLAGTTGVCRSTDGGKTWLSSLVSPLASVEVLLRDPLNPSILYAGASPAVPGGTGGVFRSTDAGLTWQELGTGLSDAYVRALVLDGARNLHAGIFGGGVAELTNSQERSPVQPPPTTGRAIRIIKPR